MKKAIRWGLAYLLVLTLLTACGSSSQKTGSDSVSLDHSASGGKSTEKTTEKAKPKEMEWKLEEGILTISGRGPMQDYDYNSAPWGNQMNVLVIEEGITHIGNNAFERCTNLSSVKLPESLESIGDKAFYKCSALNRIQIPDACTWIGDQAFDGIEDLTIMLPSGCFGLGKNVFYGGEFNEKRVVVANESLTLNHCETSFRYQKTLKSVTFEEGVTSIVYEAFEECGLEEVVLPEGLTIIEEKAFYGCDLKKVVLPKSLTQIGVCAFQGCKLLEEVVWPENLTIIANKAFADCESLSLKEVVFPESLSIIWSGAFNGYVWFLGNPSIKKVVLPGSLTQLGEEIFGWYAVEELVFRGDYRGDDSFVYSIQNYASRLLVFPQNLYDENDTPASLQWFDSDTEYVVFPRNTEEMSIYTVPDAFWVPKTLKHLDISVENNQIQIPATIQYEGNQDEWEAIEGIEGYSFANIEFNVSRPEY